MSSTSYAIEIEGEAFIAEVEYTVTSRGYPSSYDEPGEGPELEIDSIALYRDWTGLPMENAVPARATELEVPVWLKELLENSDGLRYQIVDEICYD